MMRNRRQLNQIVQIGWTLLIIVMKKTTSFAVIIEFLLG